MEERDRLANARATSNRGSVSSLSSWQEGMARENAELKKRLERVRGKARKRKNAIETLKSKNQRQSEEAEREKERLVTESQREKERLVADARLEKERLVTEWATKHADLEKRRSRTAKRMRALGKRLADSEARVSAYGHRDAVILAGGWQDEVVQAVSGLLLAAAGALGAGEIAREMLPAGVNSELAAMAVFIVALLLMISLKSAQTKRFRALEHITSAAEDTRVEELQSSDTP